MKLIDSDALPKFTGYALSALEVVKAVENAPTIDAVPVVRCEECRHGITAHGISDGWVFCSKPYTERGNTIHRDDWFCADGEPKEEAHAVD